MTNTTTTHQPTDSYDWDEDPEGYQAEQLEGDFEATSPLEARRNIHLVGESEVAEREAFAADLPHWLD